MNLDSLTHTSGEWLRGSGPESDIVISSRIRLARNLAAFPFTNRAGSGQKSEIEALLRAGLHGLDAVVCDSDPASHALEEFLRHLLIDRIVLCKQDAERRVAACVFVRR